MRMKYLLAGLAPMIVLLAAAAAGAAEAAAPAEDPAAALQARYVALQASMDNSPFGQSLQIESVEGSGALRGDVHAVLDYPLATLLDALARAENWCDVLILHLNVKYCRPVPDNGVNALSVVIGRKTEQPLDNAYRVVFNYEVVTTPEGYLRVSLDAAKGPMGTANYRIVAEATALDERRVFVHLGYAYTYGFWARLATHFYLGGAGRSKVGFTPSGAPADAPEGYVGGLRGIIERNVMRYFLAIDAYLGTQDAPAAERFERSIERWFDATERYPRQLHEVEREDYLIMKRREYQRQQPAPADP